MPFTPTIEQKGNLLVASIGLAGFDFDHADVIAKLTDFLRTPVAKRFNVLGALREDDISFLVNHGNGLYHTDGRLIDSSEDRIRVFGGSMIAGGRKVVAGTVEVDFIGTNPSKETIGISKVLEDLGHPLKNYIDGLPENLSIDDDNVWVTFPCTVEQSSNNGAPILRFDMLSAMSSEIDTELRCPDMPNFTIETMAQSGFVLQTLK